jgi:endogenous inhibitor of DNA gyrase (YacG/DUF329 family)
MAIKQFVAKKFSYLPEFRDEKGIYKFCRVCQTPFYFVDYEKALREKIVAHNKIDNILQQSWKRKATCSKPCQITRLKIIKDDFVAWAKTAKGRVDNCATCGIEFKYKERNNYKSYVYCSNKCSNIDFALTALAEDLNITKDRLRDEFILIAKKIESEQVK